MIAEIIIQTVPGRAAAVAERLTWGALQVLGGDGDHRLNAVWHCPDGATLEGFSEAVRALDPEIVAISPSYVRIDDVG